MEKHVTLEEIHAELKFTEQFIEQMRRSIREDQHQLALALADLTRLLDDEIFVHEGGVILSEEED